MSYTFISQATQQQFWQAMYTLADTLDVPLYDWRDRVGTYANGIANGVYGDINVHLTPATYANIGASLAVEIGGGSSKSQQSLAPSVPQDLTNKTYVDNVVRVASTANNAGVTTTVEAVVMKVFVPANTFKVGSAFEFSMFLHPAATTITTTRVRIGTAGTTSDACVQVIAASALTNTTSRHVEGVGGITVIGASATFIAGGTETIAANTVAVGSSTAASGTFDSTKDNWVSVTVQNTSSTTTTIYGGRIEVSI